MYTDDIFWDMDKQISSINDAVRNGTELLNEEGGSLFEDVPNIPTSETISKLELKEMSTKLGEVTDAIQIIKVARKQDFDVVKSDEHKLLDWANSHPELGGAARVTRPSYVFSCEELSTLNVFDIISKHDSYWAIDFVKTTIDTVKSEHTGFKFKCGRCERYVISDRQLKEKIRVLLHLDEDDAFGDQMIKLFGDVIDWKTEIEGKANVIAVIDSEIDMKKELMGYDYDGLKDLFEWSDDDMITYHVLHFVVKEKAKAIIAAVRMLVKVGYTPQSIGLEVGDDWEKRIPVLLGMGKSDDWSEDVAHAGLEDGDDWNDELQELEDRLERENDYMERGEKTARALKGRVATNSEGKAAATKSISIVDLNGKMYNFKSKTECMEFLKTSSATFSKFLRGQSKLNKLYRVVR